MKIAESIVELEPDPLIAVTLARYLLILVYNSEAAESGTVLSNSSEPFSVYIATLFETKLLLDL